MNMIIIVQICLVIIIAVASYFLLKPKGKLSDYHLIILGIAMICVSVLNSLIYDKRVIDVLTLVDTTGAGKSVIVGYGITLGVLLRCIFKPSYEKGEKKD